MPFAILIESLGITPNASLHGYAIDSMLEMLHWFMLILFVGWSSFYFYTLWRFQRKKSPRANYVGTTSHLPTKLEGGVLVLEIVLLMAFAAPIWASRVDQFPTGPDVIHVAAVGQQFQWDLQYTGADGKFGQRRIDLVTGSNPLGLDRSDPAAADDLTTVNEMHLPVNKPCIINVMSRDVIHDFCIPNMRIAQDAMPGSVIPMWFVPVKTGTYEIVCAQLCGSNHSLMRGVLVVESEADYKKWFDETAKLSGATVVDGKPVAPADSAGIVAK
ncbi:MAG TPA: cytochrome c oxidase subunit II [Candidatus Methylacidiphilales bacterium]|jgi:cytochrome c oxidase subunit 2|nr:cytochrome c oxidase subunit II [Candidatus Methylacidiphilales bacterium]